MSYRGPTVIHMTTPTGPLTAPTCDVAGAYVTPTEASVATTCTDDALGSGAPRSDLALSGSVRKNVSILENTVGKIVAFRRDDVARSAKALRARSEQFRDPALGSMSRRITGGEGLVSPFVDNLVIVIMTSRGREFGGGLFAVAIRVLWSGHELISSRRMRSTTTFTVLPSATAQQRRKPT